VYNQLLVLCVLVKSYGFPSGSFSFVNLVFANATPMFVKEVNLYINLVIIK
jgi:hypothetical protein